MRVFVNSIFSFIGSESLTDDEFESLSEDLEQEYTKELYEALKEILQARESVSGQLKRLKSYFIAKGVDLNAPAVTPTSQIFIGARLD